LRALGMLLIAAAGFFLLGRRLRLAA
jgi:hypothetical protein